MEASPTPVRPQPQPKNRQRNSRSLSQSIDQELYELELGANVAIYEQSRRGTQTRISGKVIGRMSQGGIRIQQDGGEVTTVPTALNKTIAKVIRY